MPGMFTTGGERVVVVSHGEGHHFPLMVSKDLGWGDSRHGLSWVGKDSVPEMIPDLDDPATLGCLLALAREAWGMKDAHVVPFVTMAGSTSADWWRVMDIMSMGGGPTEGEALCKSILAAPSKVTP